MATHSDQASERDRLYVTTPMQKELAIFHLLPSANTLALRGHFNASVDCITKQHGCSGIEENLHASRLPFMIDSSVQAYET